MPPATAARDIARRGTGGWVHDLLLSGSDGDVCLTLGRRVNRSQLRRAVAESERQLTEYGVCGDTSVAIVLPPSVQYVTTLLAAWSLGAQVVLLDSRLTDHEIRQALHHVGPHVMVRTGATTAALRGFVDAPQVVERRPDARPRTEHALVQFSSGSTGPAKIIGRTSDDLIAELGRYRSIRGMPRHGERTLILSSISHTYALVGGLLHGLHTGVHVALPERLTAAGIVAALDHEATPTTLLGVPFHVQLLAAASAQAQRRQLVRVVTAGQLLRPAVAAAFTEAFQVPLGEIYGMTEVGVIAADLDGASRPGAGRPVPGVDVRVQDGELLVRRETSPYIAAQESGRWSDGWLHTRDAAAIDATTGVIRILGRLDSQVAVGGLKVDLTEVEDVLSDIAGVTDAVVVHDEGIEAYVVLADDVHLRSVEAALKQRLAPFKLPRRWHQLPALPRTTTGKLLRSVAALRAATR